MNTWQTAPRTRTQWLRALWPAIPPVLVIYAESHAAFSAANTSGWLYPIICRYIYYSPDQWEVVHHFLRKSGHFCGYGWCAIMFLWSASRVFQGRPAERAFAFLRRMALPAMIATFLLASWDEIHQSFIPSRTSSPVDVLIDCSGGIVWLTIWFGLRVWFARDLSHDIHT